MTDFTSICALCDEPFEARTSYGICPQCYSKDHLREFDRLESAIRHAKRANLPVELTLIEWLAIVADFRGSCSYCLAVPFGYIEMVDPLAGLTKKNTVPICKACLEHKHHSFLRAEERVKVYLAFDPLTATKEKMNEKSIAVLGEIFPGFAEWYQGLSDEQEEEENTGDYDFG